MIGPRRRRRWPVVVACMLVGIGICACTSSAPKAGTKSTTGPPTTPNDYYVSLGDSYAAGWEATGPGGAGQTTTHGYAYQVPHLAAALGYHLTTVNFGCGGATTASILKSRGCAILGPGAPNYSNQTQAAAAEAFLTKHQGKIGLITVTIGGNDLVIDCLTSKDPVGCVIQAAASITLNLPILLQGLRAAAGPDVPIIGLTYPDVILGDYLSADPSTRALAAPSLTSYMTIFNPALQKQYEAVGATFVDVTEGSGAYTPFDRTTTLDPVGTVPVAVARVCQLTFFCQYGDVHPTTAGYTLIAGLITDALPKK
ncbi:MAG TPA: SGNH/GDSL hydrolase family protein [Acidimicrobiales bacterium]|jgi:lysophospholipase L1-like esterase